MSRFIAPQRQGPVRMRPDDTLQAVFYGPRSTGGVSGRRNCPPGTKKNNSRTGAYAGMCIQKCPPGNYRVRNRLRCKPASERQLAAWARAGDRLAAYRRGASPMDEDMDFPAPMTPPATPASGGVDARLLADPRAVRFVQDRMRFLARRGRNVGDIGSGGSRT